MFGIFVFCPIFVVAVVCCWLQRHSKSHAHTHTRMARFVRILCKQFEITSFVDYGSAFRAIALCSHIHTYTIHGRLRGPKTDRKPCHLLINAFTLYTLWQHRQLKPNNRLRKDGKYRNFIIESGRCGIQWEENHFRWVRSAAKWLIT